MRHCLLALVALVPLAAPPGAAGVDVGALEAPTEETLEDAAT